MVLKWTIPEEVCDHFLYCLMNNLLIKISFLKGKVKHMLTSLIKSI